MILQAYSESILQNFFQLLIQCESEGITENRYIRQKINDHLTNIRMANTKNFRGGISRDKRIEMKKRKKETTLISCSVCGAPSYVEPVNISPATMIGEGLRFAISCMNPECRNTDYSDKSILEIVGGGR